MQLVAVLLAIFALSFVAGIGWYTARRVVQFVAGAVPRWGNKTRHQAGGTASTGRKEHP